MRTDLTTYTLRESWLQRMDPRWKLASVGVSIAAVATLPTAAAALAAFFAVMLLLIASALPWRWYVSRLGGVSVFLFFIIVLLPLTLPGDEVVIGPVRLSQRGIELAALIVLKSLSVVGLTLLLLGTTPFDALLKAARALFIPGMVVQLLMLTYRFLFLFQDELGKLRIALRTRGYRNRMSRHSYRTVGHVTGTLLIRSYERAERVSQAMRCRGFVGRFHSLRTFHSTGADAAKSFILLVLSALLPWLVVVSNRLPFFLQGE